MTSSVESVFRLALFGGATAAALLAVTGPLAAAALHDFMAHAVTHVLLGMLAPLLLCLAAPLTFLLRSLPRPAARRLTWVLRSTPLRVVTEPVLAATLNVGALWLLYTTDLFALMHTDSLIHALVHLHMLVAGYVFTISIISSDPLPHRRSYRHRAIVLVAAMAAHAILAKIIYAVPPAGVGAHQAEAGAVIMYYGGDAVSVLIVIIFCARWFRDPRRSPALGVGQAGAS